MTTAELAARQPLLRQVLVPLVQALQRTLVRVEPEPVAPGLAVLRRPERKFQVVLA